MEDTYIMLVLAGQKQVSDIPEKYRESVRAAIEQRHDSGEITEDTYNQIKW